MQNPEERAATAPTLQTSRGTLTFGELEPLARALLPVLLPLMLPRIAGQKAELLQLRPQFHIEFHQGSGDAQTDRARLTGDAAAGREDQQVELVGGLSGRQRLVWCPK